MPASTASSTASSIVKPQALANDEHTARDSNSAGP
ncbi:hypothetical protein SNOG_12506 [Parastagonospora nodorum SN15]|uniref:Uncharacterized protein n=1 Tax=Phaeosphaeria nodorum (strain SN15 / ATCC MYA-4574 / FGSC 10173) TaxID=321614 RepID=Q0U6V8_PHANO|nr:hypothetical protein SNOG_12506 [Parastagonospora nodorum SN15]EAT80319.1 hypothetical protein SNOG_12506 [Parastagonospora nodorum SN15]